MMSGKRSAPGRTIELRRVRAGDLMIDATHGGTILALADAQKVPWSQTIYGVPGAASDTGAEVQRIELGVARVKLSAVPLPSHRTRWPDPALWEVVGVPELATGDWILLRDPSAPDGVLAVERIAPGPQPDTLTMHLRDTGNAPVTIAMHYAASVGRWPASQRLAMPMRPT